MGVRLVPRVLGMDGGPTPEVSASQGIAKDQHAEWNTDATGESNNTTDASNNCEQQRSNANAGVRGHGRRNPPTWSAFMATYVSLHGFAHMFRYMISVYSYMAIFYRYMCMQRLDRFFIFTSSAHT